MKNKTDLIIVTGSSGMYHDDANDEGQTANKSKDDRNEYVEY